MTLSPKLGVVEISTLWHFRLPLPIQMFIKVVSSPRLSGIGMLSLILWSHPLKMQRIVLRSSLLWWELGTNSLITGPGEWLCVSPVNYPDPDFFQFRALPFGLATSPFVFTQLMVAIVSHEENNPVSIPRWLARQESESSRSLEGQTEHSTIDFLSNTNNRSREVRIDPLSKLRFHRYAIHYSREQGQSSSRESSQHTRVSDLVSEAVKSFSQEFSFLFLDDWVQLHSLLYWADCIYVHFRWHF